LPLNISSNATSTNTTSLLNSLKEETVIQSRNGYVNLEEKAAIKKMSEHYMNEVQKNNQFENPYNHIWDKYENTSSPYYIQGLTKEERNAASQNEFNFQRWGKDNGNLMLKDDPIFKSMGYHGLERIDVESAQAGDIVCVTGIDELHISDTICDPKTIFP
jgi:predicted membrane GTPase involved in stress response